MTNDEFRALLGNLPDADKRKFKSHFGWAELRDDEGIVKEFILVAPIREQICDYFVNVR